VLSLFKAKLYVTLKKSVLDPQGSAVQKALHSLGYEAVADVRVGKYMELLLAETDRDRAVAGVKEMAERLLANPVIEEFTYELVEEKR
jgi:phosphoribosylformylglycinamidine synthase PurS subunit